MKTPSTDLHELIHSLTPAEKRVFARIGGKQWSKHRKLFDLVAEMEVYEEEVLLRKLDGKQRSYLPVAKRHLYFLLLETMTARTPEPAEEKLRRGCAFVRFLQTKGLDKQARKWLSRYKQQAQTREYFPVLLELIHLEKQLLSSKPEAEQLDRLFEEERRCLEHLSAINGYWRLSMQIGRLQWQYQKMQRPEHAEALEELIRDPLLQDFSQAINLQSQIFFLRAWATYYFTLGQAEQALEMNAQLLDTLEGASYFVAESPGVYLATLNNYLIDSLMLQRYKTLEAGLKKLKEIPQNPLFRQVENLEVQLFRQRYMLEVNWRLSTGAVEKALHLVEPISKGLERFGKHLSRPHRVSFQYLLAYLLFLNGHYAESLEWINRLLQDKEEVVQEIYQFNRILNLLVHLELGNLEHLAYLLPTTRRYLRQRRTLYETEKVLFQFLQKNIQATGPREREKLKGIFQQQIERLADQETEARFFNYVDLRLWG